LTVGDVAGKGMPAALLMARLSSEFRSCVLTDRQLTAAIARLNTLLHPFTSPMDRFVTLVAAVLDPVSHTVTLVNAGHPTPLFYHGAARKFSKAIPPEDDGQSLGHQAACRYQCYQITLNPGDSLVLFSDGVTDAQNVDGRPFRMKGIHAVLEKDAAHGARKLGERLVESVQKHAEGGSQYDDITLLCFGRPANS
jgi:serine phosphatase RsbU (regulator of sigma subunit)